MKNIKILILLLLFSASSVYAQEGQGQQVAESGKKHNADLLPVAGDIAIGIEAAPIFRFFGNMLNNNDNNQAPDLNFLNGESIFVKYFLEDNMAVRARLGVAFNSDATREYVPDELAIFNDPLSRDVVVDRMDYSFNDYLIGAELELRRGYNRLQGYYGGGVLFAISTASTKYTYGNAMSEVSPNPATTDFGNNIIGTSRVLEIKDQEHGNRIGGGLNGFVGVEYFILPKISIGGEFGLAFMYTHYSKTKAVVEYWDGFQAVEELTMLEPGDRHLRAFTLNPAIGLYFMFHF